MNTTNRGGDHGSEEEGLGQEARSEEEGGCEVRQEAREEVVLRAIAEPGAERGKVYLVKDGAGKSVRMSLNLPAGLEPDEVDLVQCYGDEDPAMHVVRAVNEEPFDTLKATIRKTLPVALDRIVISFDTETQ